MAIESNAELRDALEILRAELELGGERAWGSLLGEALTGIFSIEGMETVRTLLRKLRSSDAATRLGMQGRISEALSYFDLVLGQEPQY
jgi:hypothetical protein